MWIGDESVASDGSLLGSMLAWGGDMLNLSCAARCKKHGKACKRSFSYNLYESPADLLRDWLLAGTTLSMKDHKALPRPPKDVLAAAGQGRGGRGRGGQGRGGEGRGGEGRGATSGASGSSTGQAAVFLAIVAVLLICSVPVILGVCQ